MDEIEEEDLFTPVPMEGRLLTGVTNVKELAKRQRKNINTSAVSGSSSDTPPEVRIKKLTNAGNISMRFTSSLKVPEDAAQTI